MSETVVILLPDMGGQQVVQRRDLPPPRQVARDLQPLGVLVEHRIHNVDESFIAVEKPVPAGQQIAFEPAFALVFAQHFHDATVQGEEFVVILVACVPLTLGHLEDRVQAIGKCFVGAKDAEIALLPVEFGHVAQEHAQYMRVGRLHGAWRRHVHRVVRKSGMMRSRSSSAPVGVGIRAHAAFAFGREFGQFRFQSALLVEKLLRPVAAHPLFKLFKMFGMRPRIGERHLMRAERAFDLQAVHPFRARPAFR